MKHKVPDSALILPDYDRIVQNNFIKKMDSNAPLLSKKQLHVFREQVRARIFRRSCEGLQSVWTRKLLNILDDEVIRRKNK